MQNFCGGSDGGNFYPAYNQYGVKIEYINENIFNYFLKEGDAVNKVQQTSSNKEQNIKDS